MDLIIFGIQGSGKGTQGEKIAKKYNLKVFEMGGELRKLANENSPLAQKIKKVIESGQLVSNDIIMEIVENFLKQIPKEKNILFDGIPRQIGQQQSLTALLRKFDRETKTLLIHIPKEEAVKRLTTRRICPACKKVFPAFYPHGHCDSCQTKLVTRTDDNLESIYARLDAYEKETLPVIEIYKNEGSLITINGKQNIEKVSADIFQELDKIY